jgi:REP element-mobilizing transposase RayT
MSSQLDTNPFPLAYLITFRTYGSWMHGEDRGSVDRKHNIYGTPRLVPNLQRELAERRQLNHSAILLSKPQRRAVESAIREVCCFRRYDLLAVNVRTNDVHAVISGACMPEPILDALKAYATRKLRREGLIPVTTKPWASPRSTQWKGDQVDKAVAYGMYDRQRGMTYPGVSCSPNNDMPRRYKLK